MFSKIRKSLKAKVLTIITINAFVIGMGMIVVMYFVTLNTLINDTKNNLKTSTLSEALNESNKLDNGVSFVSNLANIPAFNFHLTDSRTIPFDANKFLKEQAEKNDFKEVGIINLGGKIVLNSNPEKVGSEIYKESRFFNRALVNEQSVCYKVDFKNKKLIFFAFSPIKSNEGRILGASYAIFNNDNLFSGLQSTTLSFVSHIMIVDADGTVIYSTNETDQYKSLWTLTTSEQKDIITKNKSKGSKIESLFHDPLKDVFLNYKGPEIYDHKNEKGKSTNIMHGVAKSGTYPLYLVTEFDRQIAQRAALNNAMLIFVLCISLIIFYEVTSNIMLARQLRPLKTLQKSVESILRGNLNQNIEIKTQDEYKELADTLNALTRELRKRQVIADIRKKMMNEADKPEASSGTESDNVSENPALPENQTTPKNSA